MNYVIKGPDVMLQVPIDLVDAIILNYDYSEETFLPMRDDKTTRSTRVLLKLPPLPLWAGFLIR